MLGVIGAVVSEFDTVADNFAELALAALTLSLAAMAVAFTIARFAGLDERQTTAIALQLGVHNSTLAIAVATTVATTWLRWRRCTACSCSSPLARSRE